MSTSVSASGGRVKVERGNNVTERPSDILPRARVKEFFLGAFDLRFSPAVYQGIPIPPDIPGNFGGTTLRMKGEPEPLCVAGAVAQNFVRNLSD